MMFVKKILNNFNIRNEVLSIRTYKDSAKFRKMNPGVNHRLKMFKEEQPNIENIKIDEESLDHLEHDVTNSEELRDIHKREIFKVQKKIRLKQIERKYFSPRKLLNFLLWSEKEQIRLLSQTDPDLWTPQKLSECFPAIPEIIRKIMKSQWKPENVERIKAHDKAVNANWLAFEMGKLNIPEELERHLKMFTSRKEMLFKEESNLPIKTEKRLGEFSRIIEDYKNKANSDVVENKEKIPQTISRENDSFLLGRSYNRSRTNKEYTLEVLRNAAKGKEISDDSSQMEKEKYSEISPNVMQGFINEEETLNESKTFEDDPVTEIENISYNTYRSEDIPMKINIPKEKWKKGSLYKLNKSYYTDDGEFLYRV